VRQLVVRVFTSVLLLVLATGIAAAQPISDWERAQQEKNWKEGKVVLPPYPKPGNLISFAVSATTDFKFFIDSASLSVGDDGVVRYTVVARSASGVDNVSYEGIHCRDGTYKVYAFGQSNGTWRRNPLAQWRPVEAGSVMLWRQVLRNNYFCPQNLRIRDATEGLAALKRGGAKPLY